MCICSGVCTCQFLFLCICSGGVYMAAVVHHDGRILVTSEDVVPVVEVDTDFAATGLNADLHWLTKV